MLDRDIDLPSQATVSAAGAPRPPAFPASAFNLAPAAKADASKPKEKTRVQLAIEHITEHGPATNAELVEAMGLKAGVHPGAYLSIAVRDGRLAVHEGRYHLAPLPPPEAAEQPPADLPEAPWPALAAALAPTTEFFDPTPAVQILPTDVAVIARADGSVLISVDGQAVDLTPKQVHLLQAFHALLPQLGGTQ
ncbi:hypothetical protein [Cupriavidus sp. WS]|uniref:hypothetical protein n=1 Tax=Cupriavidus sp. WS TaxID=1312922 RepID=UPI00036B9243|nr:hypothetical protein [Cupriavidus sp. WS]